MSDNDRQRLAQLAACDRCTQGVMDEWVALFASRDELAVEYALLLKLCPSLPKWPSMNHAIVDRWSVAALIYIKRKARRLVTAEERP